MDSDAVEFGKAAAVKRYQTGAMKQNADQVKRLAAQGLYASEIARQLGVSREYVRQLRVRHAIPIERWDGLTEKYRQAIDDYVAGVPNKELRARGVDMGRLYQAMRVRGIPRRQK